MNTKPNNEWIKEFDKKFSVFDGWQNIIKHVTYSSRIKSFITKTLQQQREDLIEEIEKKFPDIDNSEKVWIEKQLYDAKEIHKFLQSLKEK